MERFPMVQNKSIETGFKIQESIGVLSFCVSEHSSLAILVQICTNRANAMQLSLDEEGARVSQ
jgi:hypothetical protein